MLIDKEKTTNQLILESIKKKKTIVIATRSRPVCGPCIDLAHRVQPLINDKAKGWTNVHWLDQEMDQMDSVMPNLFKGLKVTCVPQLLLFKGGKLEKRLIGNQHTEKELKAFSK